MANKYTTIGGQALIEGIMMKGPKKTALAVRLPDGGIDVSYLCQKQLKDRWAFFGLPVIRGVVGFIEAMVSGYKALMLSAEKSGFADLEEEQKKQKKPKKKKKGEEDPVETWEAEYEALVHTSHEGGDKPAQAQAAALTAQQEARENGQADAQAAEQVNKDKKTSPLMSVLMVVAVILGVGLALVLFMLLPATLFDWINISVGGAITAWRGLFEGLLKMLIFFGYMIAVSQMKDIKRLFQYHGAEHKTIFCYEANQPLTVENIRPMRRFHPRCGTSFMIVMLFVGILLTVLISNLFPAVTAFRPLWVAIKILMLPLICGLGYELIRICGRHDNVLTRIISAPGLWMQRITTKEPEDSMLEIAVAALEAVAPEEPDVAPVAKG